MHRPHQRAPAGLAFGIACLVAACSDAEPTRSAVGSAEPNTRMLAAVHTLDALFDSIGARAPEFAGLYFDDRGTLVIRSSDMARAASVRSLLRAGTSLDAIEGAREAMEEGRVRYAASMFSFNQLRRWRDAIYRRRPLGLVWLDIDEVNNRVALGVETAHHIAAVEGDAVGLGLPRSAFHIVASGRPQRQASLRDRIRPIPGGVKVDGALECTIGANAKTGLDDGFIVSSHCTGSWGVLDAQAFVQNQAGSGNFVGYESADPPLLPPATYCGPRNPNCCSAPGGCRYSDAAFVSYTASATFHYGMLARPTNFSGSITINSSKPRLFIKSSPMTLLPIGATVYKIGSGSQSGVGISGARQGTVTGTCFTYIDWFPNKDLLCQTTANYHSVNGDSGGPIFSWDGYSDSVVFRGIHNGLQCPSCIGQPHFSPWRFIAIELGDVLGGLTVSLDGEEGPGGPG